MENDVEFIGKVKLSKQGQLTLPTEARNALHINPEDNLYWYEYKGSLVLVKDLLNPKDLKAQLRRKR